VRGSGERVLCCGRLVVKQVNSKMDHQAMEDEDDTSSYNTSPPQVVLNAKDGIASPGPNDIICGRGKSIAHKGNARFRQLISEKKAEYQAAKRREDKSRITVEIVEELRKTSKFLLKDPKLKLWFEVGEEYQKEKVSHALRSRGKEECRNKRPKPKKKMTRKLQQSPAMDEAVESLIQEQQEMLKTLIERCDRE